MPTTDMTDRHLLRMRLAIPAHEYLAYYRNQADAVLARTLDGRSIEFPAIALRRHVTHGGVHGLFEIEFDADYRLIRLERVGN